MKPATNLREFLPNLWCWSAYHEGWKVDFNSCAWKGEDELVLVDPVRLDDANLAKLEKIAPPAAILLTNQNHERDAEWFRDRYGIKIHAHRDAVPGIEITPDEFFCDGTALPGGLKAVHLPGVSLSETAFYAETGQGIVILGDALLNEGGKGLRFLPDQYCKDPQQNRLSLRRLLQLQFETITFAHGDPISPGARQKMAQLAG